MKKTNRTTCEALEELLYTPLPVLDKGFIRVIDYMGDDSAIVQAARVSYGKGTKHTSQDKALINYLMRHWHSSPFEMCEIKLHVKLPIFVARQWIRHRTANVNEYSARYSVLDREFYLPEPSVLAAQSSKNNQGREEQPLAAEDAKRVIRILEEDALRNYDTYETLLEDNRVARELARMNLTLNYYTQWYWKTDLHNLLHFLMLRADSHAQYEIRAYADVLLDVVKQWVPYTYEAFMEHRLNGTRLSKTATETLRRMLTGEAVTQESSGLTAREWTELVKKFQPSS